MSKRKFSEVKSWEGRDSGQNKHVVQNSLDSDEDDTEEEHKYMLNDEDIEGQEEGGAILEEGVQFTPFNMKEELEEGHFDKDGMYHWKKNKEIKDSWLENIDWIKIKERKAEDKDKRDSDDDMPEAVDTTSLYKELLTFMQPKESVGKTLQRLGGKKSLSASERLKLKKAGLLAKTPSEDDSEKVTKFTELANKILTLSGNMDIYQETFEHITDLVNASCSKSQEPELDMYADDFGTKEQERLNETATTESKPKENTNNGSGFSGEQHGQPVMWEFKWKLESSEVEGPHTTEQMEKWSQSGYFGKGAFARKCGALQFYSTNRIDFDLYL